MSKMVKKVMICAFIILATSVGHSADSTPSTSSGQVGQTQPEKATVTPVNDKKVGVVAAIKTVLGKELKVAFILMEPTDAPRRRPGYSDEALPDGFNEEEGSAKKEVDPIIKTALEIFGGDIADGPQNRKMAR